MTLYLVEAYVPQLDEARARTLAGEARSAAGAMAIRHLSSIFVPEDDLCFHLLEAGSADSVREAWRRAGLPFERVVVAVRPRSNDERSVLMPQFLVERHLPGFPPEQLPAAAGAAKRKSIEVTGEGSDVRYIRSTWVPEGERCYCLFEASSSGAVAEVQKRAELPFEHIYEAAFLTAEDV